MYKVAILDDDNHWGFALQRFFKKEFEVSIFIEVDRFLSKASHYDLVIVDFSIPSARYETSMTGSEIIRHLKEVLNNPPLLVLMSGFISKNDLEAGRLICPQADAFLAKDMGLDNILVEIKQLLEKKQYPDGRSPE